MKITIILLSISTCLLLSPKMIFAQVQQMLNEKENTEIIEMKNVFFSKMDCDLIPFYAVG